jgi:cell division transport system ATP-binding protein
MLSLTNIEFRYQDLEIFSNLNFEMNNGEFIFLIGRSGSGKSTLLQMINMNLQPDSGTVQFLQFNSALIKPKEIPYVRRKIGIVYQDYKLLRDRTVYENLQFVLRATGTPKSDIGKKINNVLTDVGLSHRRYSMPDELSGGEKQRIAIARAVINNPVLILADEPTGNLDPETTDEIIQIFSNINRQGTAVLFATHNYDLIKRNDYKIYKLDNGRVVKAVIRQKQS